MSSTIPNDLGDNWEHVITVESFNDKPEYDPRGGAFISDGARACPPEDVGGSDGYHDFIETLLVHPQSAEAQQMRDWAGGYFDPQQCDIRIANAAILRMMHNGWGGKYYLPKIFGAAQAPHKIHQMKTPRAK